MVGSGTKGHISKTKFVLILIKLFSFLENKLSFGIFLIWAFCRILSLSKQKKAH